MIDGNKVVLLIVGGFAKQFMLWSVGALSEVFPGAHHLVAIDVEDAIKKGYLALSDVTFLPADIEGLKQFCQERSRLGRDPRGVIVCAQRNQDEDAGHVLVTAMNLAGEHDALYMLYGESIEPLPVLKFVRIQVADLLRPESSAALQEASAT